MSDGSNQAQMSYEVVINQEGQYSIWPANKIVPNGWSTVGTQDTKEACLAFISEVWTDMRPISLRASAQPG
jgi:MbtH protein